MKKDIHPQNYRMVIFEDTSSGSRFLVGSTREAESEDTWEDGKKYPLIKVEISSQSHPFYTGKDTVIDTAGRAERFKRMQEASLAKQKHSQGKKKDASESKTPAQEKTTSEEAHA